MVVVSGVGKSSIVARLLGRLAGLRLSVSATTRPPRPTERDGVDYHFVTEKQFRRLIEEGRMLEWAQVFGYLYGTPAAELERAEREGKTLLLDIDVDGVAQLRNKGIEGLYIFIAPPSMEELERRLRGRGTENEKQLAKRLARARYEMEKQTLFDAVVVNDSLDRAVEEVINLIVSRLGERVYGPGKGDKQNSETDRQSGRQVQIGGADAEET